MAIGTLYVEVPPPVFIPTGTLLGTMHLTSYRGRAIPTGPFDVRLNTELLSLDTPLRFYDVLSVITGDHIGFGFLAPVPAEVLTSGLIFRYTARLTQPELVYRSPEFCVYHAVNCATVVTRPILDTRISDLLFAI